ncbi:hypothetical protein BAUCODRAFT_238033 [Baudoinia panamericana UAMH 10762]|uniref:Uncharacterized protein n=1 Tax=Baudoinia panamericana (strain UAMH 10762) TaxID=717646 RepID=M2N3R2_BAUPA|nr:uncharacterized protein BAUCODRAFT_238033 [Baudoinia panamericana UAMH 10762]EMC93360.1 hypothetical protein BAUCODRAFT_238033 [Baudoinia panamericana UAMH 10762]
MRHEETCISRRRGFGVSFPCIRPSHLRRSGGSTVWSYSAKARHCPCFLLSAGSASHCLRAYAGLALSRCRARVTHFPRCSSRTCPACYSGRAAEEAALRAHQAHQLSSTRNRRAGRQGALSRCFERYGASSSQP